jgi:hypothetical protein
MDTDIGKELFKIMDALVALKIDLQCDPTLGGEVLVLSAEKSRSACDALDTASTSIKDLVALLAKEGPGGKPLH